MSKITCPDCHGDGQGGHGMSENYGDCGRCKGSGRIEVAGETCPECNGSGTYIIPGTGRVSDGVYDKDTKVQCTGCRGSGYKLS